MLTLNEITENLKQLFALEEYSTAAQIIETARELPELYDDTIAIYDASLCQLNNNYPQMWTAIRRGLSCNCRNFELYLLLGEYYLPTNPDQACLCFENALFYCTDADDSALIQSYIDNLKKECRITVKKTSFIILSCSLLDYTKNCIESIRATVPETAREIIVVDNASTDGSIAWLKEQQDIIVRENKENSGFTKGCNEGIELASRENDIFLLNNDTQLTPNALFWLRMGLYENETHGTAGSVSNCVPNLQKVPLNDFSIHAQLSFGEKNNVPMNHPYEEKLFLIGFALLIRRTVLDKLGGLDERFSPGNYEDTDYGLRVLQAGYKNILCKNSFIIHFGSKTFEKTEQDYDTLLNTNKKKFKEKWGIDESHSLYPRQELAARITEDQETPFTLLDIGCGCGATAAFLKGKYPHATMYGVEISPTHADIASHLLDVICADIETLDFPWPENYFDYVILGDVLAHLRQPAHLLRRLHRHVKKGGHIIVSMPNIKHYSYILPLIIKDRFPSTENDIPDTTHRKLYTGEELLRLISGNGYHNIEYYSYTTAGTPDEATSELIDLLVSLSESKERFPYLAYQYIVKAQKTEF